VPHSDDVIITHCYYNILQGATQQHTSACHDRACCLHRYLKHGIQKGAELVIRWGADLNGEKGMGGNCFKLMGDNCFKLMGDNCFKLMGDNCFK
jgi:hypothetical protein